MEAPGHVPSVPSPKSGTVVWVLAMPTCVRTSLSETMSCHLMLRVLRSG